MALIAVLVAVLIGAAVVARASFETTDRFVDEWARAHDLVTTDANRPLVQTYLHNARLLRTIGVLGIGFALPAAAGFAFGIASSPSQGGRFPLHWGWVFGGHLIGALYAEVALRRPVPAGPRTASLAPRNLDDYLPRYLIAMPWVVSATTAVVALTLATRRRLSVGEIVLVSLALALPVVLRAAQAWVLARPQAFTAPDMIAADDAIRAQSVHMIAGSGSAAIAALFGPLAAELAPTLRAPWGGLVAATAIASFYFALCLCLYFGHRRWAVTRTGFSTPAATNTAPPAS